MLDDFTLKLINKVDIWGRHTNIYKYLKINDKDIFNNLKVTNKFDYVFIDGEDFIKLNEEDKVDLALDLIDIKRNIYVTNSNKDIEKMFEELGVTNIVIEKNYKDEVLLTKLDISDLNVLAEIFEYNVNPGLNMVDLSVTLEVTDKGGNLVDYRGNKLNIEKSEFGGVGVVRKVVNKKRNFMIYLLEKYYGNPFEFSVYEPLFNIDELDEVLEYKWKVFKKVRDMTIEDMEYLPEEVISFCNQNEFILFKDAVEVLSGDYPFMKYYQCGGEVLND